MEKSENWYKQFTDKLELSGMSPRTQEAYSRAVRLLKDHCNKDPWEITEQDVQDYLLYRKNTSKWAPSTLKVALCGIRYYYQLIHKVNWEIFKIAKFNNRVRGGESLRLPTAPCVRVRTRLLMSL